MSAIRTDRAELASPRASFGGTTIYSGVAARTHSPDDPLVYPSSLECRDAAELRQMAEQLNTGKVPVTWGHPSNGRIADSPDARVVGRVMSARVVDDAIVVDLSISDADANARIRAGEASELSLAYETKVAADGQGNKYQRGAKIDALGVVSIARCGAVCAIRKDERDCACSSCNSVSKSVSRKDVSMTRSQMLKQLKELGYPRPGFPPLDQLDDQTLAAHLAVAQRNASDESLAAQEHADGVSEEDFAAASEAASQQAYREMQERNASAWIKPAKNTAQRADADDAPPSSAAEAYARMVKRNQDAWKAGR